MANSFVPESDKVLAATPLVLTGNTYKLYFKAPTTPASTNTSAPTQATVLPCGARWWWNRK